MNDFIKKDGEINNLALLLAAGKSSRMGENKVFLDFCGEELILHMARKFFSAGIDKLIIVTGYQADRVRNIFIEKSNIYFVHNKYYWKTEMFDSVKLGLKESLDLGAENVLISPIDIPLQKEDTIKKLLKEEKKLVIPKYRGENGHPVKINRSIIPDIISYRGDGGLNGALQSIRVPAFYIEVDDPYISWDMDTPQDYKEILEISKREKRRNR